MYDEKTWAADRKADGFRLPTRRNGNTWPPVAARTVNTRGATTRRNRWFMAISWRTALDVPVLMRSQEAQGAVVVGSFPKGASRDGVMDLAGNVAQWCGDWYQLYTSDEKTDPLETRESHSRVLRGGSWGYYGCSQRAKDREFNSQTYPGYIYVGFRVAIPDAGWCKLPK